MFVSNLETTESWKGFTLVIPAVSVGNVGQLTVDLLISTIGMQKCGYFYDDSFLPVIGNDPFAIGDSSQTCQLMTAVEVYYSPERKVVTIQQRSPFFKGKKEQFLQKLMEWIKDCQFQDIVIVTSTFAHERLDCQLQGTQQRYMLTPALERKIGRQIRDEHKWTELEKRPMPPGVDRNEATEIFMPGGGIAKSLFRQCKEEDLDAAILLTFCAEGDNAHDAVQLASYLNSWRAWLDLKKAPDGLPSTLHQGWKFPSSWKLLFGSRFDQILFQ